MGESRKMNGNIIGLIGISCTLNDFPSGNTSFSNLSEIAQDYIVRAVLGEFHENPPQNIPDDVKMEIAKWASE